MNTEYNTNNALEESFVRELIKNIEKTYKVTIKLNEQLISEINSTYPHTSGCSFTCWLNHRLYSHITTDCLLNDMEIPEYTHWEDLDRYTDEEEEEEDDWYVPCKCNTSMDIRGRCDPVRSAKQFSRCPARFDTAYFHINNDYEKYKSLEGLNRGEKQQKIIQYAREEPYFLEDDNLEDELLYLIEQDEEQEEEDSDEEEQYTCAECGCEGMNDPEDLCSDCIMRPIRKKALCIETFAPKNPEELEHLVRIAEESDYINIKPFSHNIVSIRMRILEEDHKYERKDISLVVTTFGLDKKGWGHLVVKEEIV